MIEWLNAVFLAAVGVVVMFILGALFLVIWKESERLAKIMTILFVLLAGTNLYWYQKGRMSMGIFILCVGISGGFVVAVASPFLQDKDDQDHDD